MKKIFVIIEQGGQYEDSWTRVVKAYEDKNAAEKFINAYNSKQDMLELTSDDWMDWYDKLDEIFPYDENNGEQEDWCDTKETALAAIKTYIPEASLKYSDQEIIDIYKYHIGSDAYDRPIMTIKEIELI